VNKITGQEQIEKKIRQLVSSQDYLSKKIIIGLKESALEEIYDEMYNNQESNFLFYSSAYKEEFERLGFSNLEGIITRIKYHNRMYNTEPYLMNSVSIDIQAISSQETFEIYSNEIAYISEQQKEEYTQLSLF